MFLSIFHMDIEAMDGVDFMDPKLMPEIARATYNSPGMKSALVKTLPQLMYKGVIGA